MIKDTYELNGFRNTKLPKLKGHLKITLKNVHNGKTEIVEGDNIVTNAVADIFAHNFLGKLNYNTMMPLWSKWYGGVLCYQNPHPTIEVGGEQVLDPDNYFLHGDNPLTAHAGGTTIDAAHDDNLKRGNPTTAVFELTDHSVKQVWEWGTTHGNGTISALSLTHKDTGDAGLGNAGYVFSNFVPFETLFSEGVDTGIYQGDSVLFQYDDNHGIAFTIQPDGTYWRDDPSPTDTITFYVKRLPYNKAGLFETIHADNNSTRVKKFTVTTSVTFRRDPCYYWDEETKRLWLFTNITSNSGTTGMGWSKTTINYSVVDLSDLDNPTEYAHGTLTSDTADLAPIGAGVVVDYARLYVSMRYQVIKDGDAFWFPLCDNVYWDSSSGYRFGLNAKAFKRISTTSASQVTSNFNQTIPALVPAFYGGDGVVISDGGVIYGSNGFACGSMFGTINASHNFGTRAFNHNKLPVSYVVATDRQNYTSDTHLVGGTRYILANKMLNTTLFNLPTPISKSASQAMTVEYTLQEVPNNE